MTDKSLDIHIYKMCLLPFQICARTRRSSFIAVALIRQEQASMVLDDRSLALAGADGSMFGLHGKPVSPSGLKT